VAAPAPAPAPPPPAATAPPVQQAPAPAIPSTPTVVPEAARRLIDLVNGERARAGLGQVVSREDITAIALEHSHRMAAAGNIFHNDGFFSTTVKNLLGSLARGENVAQNTSIDDAHRRLMNSPGHRANILDGRFDTVGFAVVRTASGQFWITQAFAQTRGGAAPAPAPAAAPTATTRAPAPRPVATTVPVRTPAPAPVAPPEPAPVAVEVASEAVPMAEAIPAGPLAPATASTPGTGSRGMGASIAVLVTVLIAGAALGSWQLRRMTAGLWA